MVKEKRRKDQVERLVLVWKLGGEAAVESHLDRSGLGLGAGTRKNLRIGVEPDDFGPRLGALDHDRERSRPAADVEDPLARLWGRLLEQALLEPPLASGSG
jgi:hypothetical protein